MRRALRIGTTALVAAGLVLGGVALASALPLRVEAGTRTSGSGIVVPASSGAADSPEASGPETGSSQPDASGGPQVVTPSGTPSPGASAPAGPQPVRPGPPIELDR